MQVFQMLKTCLNDEQRNLSLRVQGELVQLYQQLLELWQRISRPKTFVQLTVLNPLMTVSSSER